MYNTQLLLQYTTTTTTTLSHSVTPHIQITNNSRLTARTERHKMPPTKASITSVITLFRAFFLRCESLWTIFTMPRYASAVYAVVVCLSVYLSHSGIVSKRLNVGSRK